MLSPLKTSFGDMLISLSDAIDLASPEIAAHQLRVAFVAWRMAEAAKLPKRRVEALFIAGLFHDIGALSLESKIRVHRSEVRDVDLHCKLGESLFELTPALFGPSKDAVRHHHTPWSAWEEPIESPAAFDSQVLLLADLLERSIDRNVYILHQSAGIDRKMRQCAGSEIHTDVVDIYLGLSKREAFWLDLASPRLYLLLLNHGPLRGVELQHDEIHAVAQTFSHIIDFKSRFTATHTTGVAVCGAILARSAGVPEDEIRHLMIAGYFHDLGKLAVPNSILNKPAGLSSEEFSVMKQHTYHTYTILSAIDGLDHLAEWASFHHEKLDGSGYPFHASSERISLKSRILTVADIFTALYEDRPYRPGMRWKEIKAILQEGCANNALDPSIVKLLTDDYEEIHSHVADTQIRAGELFMEKFSRAEAA